MEGTGTGAEVLVVEEGVAAGGSEEAEVEAEVGTYGAEVDGSMGSEA